MKTVELQDIKRRYNIVGNCDALNRALDVAIQVASTDLSVLIEGESGVGKEIIPRVIHDLSPRHHERYFAINCGSIPEGTIDSELFGHEKGAFTGAVGDREGYFGVANKGTIFLDEVGELPMATQARLLRVLETGEYIRVGGQSIRKTDVRIVAATNVNVRKAISEGRFREDLYYRLNTIPIQMPPLRDRGNDIVLLFRLFAMQMAEKYRLPRIELTDGAKLMLMKYKWPGNIRQLKHITEQMSVLCRERTVDEDALKKFIPVDPESTMLAPLSSGDSHSYESERELLYKILYDLKGNVSDLRRELNGLRDKLDNASAMPQQMQGYSELPQGYVPNMQQSQQFAPSTPQMEYAEVEEVKEPEVLNITDVRRALLQKALDRNGGNRKKAAAELGISDRTLYRQIKQYGLNEN
ncbi:MAG: sigma-54 dependent transcriptional regulator [Prevotellaceae bacterium]|nr:sigma-54 dependent transcriptional regulator [Prevotellaceae bacterium]